MKEKRFDIKYTNLLKGIAVLLLLLHHVLNLSYPYTSIVPKRILVHLVSCGKICVAIFLILSGYGMYLSYNKIQEKNAKQDVIFIARHVIKILLSFWIIYIICVPVSILFGYSFIEIYGQTGHLWINMLTDFLGMAYLRGMPSMNPTWWYLDVILVYYLISPLLFRVIKRMKKKSCIFFIIFVILTFNFYGLKMCVIYFIPYLSGAIMAEINGIEKVLKFGSKFEWIKQVVMFGAFLGIVYVREVILAGDIGFYKLDWLLALILIYFSYFYLSTEGKIGKSLISLGKQSGNIFFFHSFIYKFWLQDLVYGTFKYGILIYIVFLLICYIISKLLEYLQEKTGMNNIRKSLNDPVKAVIAAGIYVSVLLVSYAPIAIGRTGIGNLSISTHEDPMHVGTARRLEIENDILCGSYVKGEWSSSDDAIVTVSYDGVLTAQNEGTAEVMFRLGRKKVVYTVEVTNTE